MTPRATEKPVKEEDVSFSTEFLVLSHIILEGEMRTSTGNNVSILSANTDGGDRCDPAVPAG